MKLSNKFLLILLVSVVLLCLFSSSVFAYEVSSNNNNFYISDAAYDKLKTFNEYNSDYYYFACYWEGCYEFYFLPKEYNKNLKFYFTNKLYSSSVVQSIHWYKCDSNFNITSSRVFNGRFENVVAKTSDGKYHYLANFDIYTNNTYTDFFLTAPLTLQQVVEKSLAETLDQEILGTQLTTLIKVGLIIFGLLLAPFLIKFRSW